jgi:sterol 24-C-methyltransferase
VDRGNQLCVDAQLAPRCKLVRADFHKLPFAHNTFDHVFSIESCCHSPDRADVYREIFRVLKPGGQFASYEWCLTKVFDPSNPKHLKCKRLIEEGDALPELKPTTHCDEALTKVSGACQ